MIRCKRCEVGGTRSEMVGGLCRPCSRLLAPDHPRVTEAHRHGDLRLEASLRLHGIDFDRWTQMMTEQDGRCAICGSAPLGNGRLLIDHNHETGEVRGLLCGPCNTALGMFQDSPDTLRAAVEYLTERGHYGKPTVKEQAS